MPVICTRLAAGAGTACSRSSWVVRASENSGAVLLTVRNALPSLTPVAADGGPAGRAADERAARRGHRRHIGHLRQRGGIAGRARRVLTAVASGITTVTLVAESTAKSLRS